jgi:hypothetical protein
MKRIKTLKSVTSALRCMAQLAHPIPTAVRGLTTLGRRTGGFQTRLVAVDADDRCDVELELVELLDKFFDPRARPHLTVARADVVGFDEKSFLGKIDYDQIFCVRGRERMDLDLPRAVAEDSMAAAERFDDNGPFVALQTVGIARMRRACDFRIECLGVKRHDYRCALGHKRANPTGVIEMMMGRDRVTDRLAGESLFDRLDHRRGAGLKISLAGLRCSSRRRVAKRPGYRRTCLPPSPPSCNIPVEPSMISTKRTV